MALRQMFAAAGLAGLLAAGTGGAMAWDSIKRNPTHPTHTYLTEYAIKVANKAEIGRYRAALIAGANQELHELPVKGSAYGIDLDARRIRHRGTNVGTDDIDGWWQDTIAAYRAGRKEQAYFLLGIILHHIQDMGVPAHANDVYHQGNAREFDNFEAISTLNWKPDFRKVNKSDPRYADPTRYYAFSRAWTREDAPTYRDRDAFSKTWTTASRAERRLVRARQARTATIAAWALQAAYRAFAGE